jgi:phosphatidylethanolamine/phosphatidyl-N-methylethanolamine N-methyltransferase
MSRISSNKTRARDENLLFFKRLLKNPASVGAVVPSSLALSRFMCQHVECHSKEEFVVEIGAGTGRFTQALLNQGLLVSQIIAVELDSELANFLRNRFPELIVIEGDATQLEKLLPSYVLGKVRTVISGIPMVNMPKDVQKEIVRSAFSILTDGGKFLQFTYGPVSPIPARSLGLVKKRLGHIFLNFPPATVWGYERVNTKTGERQKKDLVKSIKSKFKLAKVKANAVQKEIKDIHLKEFFSYFS